jgi:signal transduction histidine kinase
MQLVEKGQLTRDETLTLLSEAMDELRIAIDSMKPSAQDLLATLGNLRYRIEPRLASAGIRLAWQVGEIPGIALLTPHQVIECTRIVQEALANAIKHSQASAMLLAIEAEGPTGVRITLSDNGAGFDTGHEPRGEGLKSMRARAQKIGARFELSSRPGATRIEIIVQCG